jgi:predicted ester cyclase
VVYGDWQGSIERQADALMSILLEERGTKPQRILDAAVGVGTQALGLAARGCSLTGADISLVAVRRAMAEAHGRGVKIKDRVAAVRSAFPDFHITIEDQMAEDDKVVTRQTHRGTHKGAFMGIAPTGAQVETTETSILRIADGKICEVWVNVDLLTLLRQIGATSIPNKVSPLWVTASWPRRVLNSATTRRSCVWTRAGREAMMTNKPFHPTSGPLPCGRSVRRRAPRRSREESRCSESAARGQASP